MADEIKQVFSLDASQAIDATKLLDSSFAALQGRLNNFQGSFNAFNASAGKTVSALVQITQNATAAAAALNKLNSTKPAPTVGTGDGNTANPATSLLTGQAAAQAFNTLLGQTTQSANAAAGAINNLGSNAQNSLNGAARAGSGFAVSLETITRVISTQLIVRALNSIRAAVEDSFQGFINFNRAAAEIQTILDQPLAKIRDDVRTLSDQFNAPILDVAKAKYQALSNGFVTASESTQILTAALKFAKVGIASTEESVDLISSTLNAYGKSADEAESLSAKLFKTIELGRVVGSELANSFGRVAPIAKEIGASEDEILAAFSSITIGGVKASEAATQIRATLTSLLKPSADATDAFRKLGVESGEELISAFGFQGALKALIGTTDGTTSAIAKLFPNVRALNGVLRETGTASDIFSQHLNDIRQASADLLNKKFELRIDSNAEQVSAAINKLSNLFTVDFGQTLVGATGQALAFVGGADRMVNVLASLAPVVAAVVLSLGAYGLACGAASVQASLLANASGQAITALTALKTAIGGVIAFVAAFQFADFLSNELDKLANKQIDAIKNRSQQALDLQRSQNAAQLNLANIAADEQSRVINRVLASASSAYFAQVDASKEANQQTVDDSKATLDKLILARERFATDLRRASQKAQNDSIASQKRTIDLTGQLADQQFNFRISRQTQLNAAIQAGARAAQLAGQGSTQLASARTPAQREQGENTLQRATAFAQLELSIGKTTNNLALQVQAERTLNTVTQTRINSEKAYQAQRAKDADILNKQAADEAAKVTKLKDLTKDFLQTVSGFDKKGNLLPDSDRLTNQKQATDLLGQIQEIAFSKSSKLNISDLLSFNDLGARLQQSVTKAEITQLNASPKAFSALNEQIQKSLDDFRFVINVVARNPQISNLPADQQLAAAKEANSATTENIQKQNAALTQRQGAEQQIATSIKDQNQLLSAQPGIIAQFAEAWLNVTASAGDFISGDTDLFKSKLNDLDALQKKLAGDTGTTRQQVIDLANAYSILAQNAPASLKFDLNNSAAALEELSKIVQSREVINQLNAAGLTDQERLNLLNQQDEAANAAKVQLLNQGVQAERQRSAAVQATANSERQVAANIQVSNNNAAQLAANFAKARQEAIETYQAGSLIAPQSTLVRSRAFGGLAYLASGGLARGTDTQAAMLSPGETVINANSSRKFFSQIQAIQAGNTPIFRQQGGSVTNISVGDINVNGAGHPKSTANEVLAQINRAGRRGSGQIRH